MNTTQADLFAGHLQFQCNAFQVEAGVKEYAADWLKNAKTVARDASGQFASKAGSASKAVSKAAGDAVEKASAATKSAKDAAEAGQKAIAGLGIQMATASAKLNALKGEEKQKVQAAFADAVKDPRVQKLISSLKSAAGKLKEGSKEAVKALDDHVDQFKKDAGKALKTLQKSCEIVAKGASTPSVAAAVGISVAFGIAAAAVVPALLMAAGMTPLGASLINLIALPITNKVSTAIFGEFVVNGVAKDLIEQASKDLQKIIDEENEKFADTPELVMVKK